MRMEKRNITCISCPMGCSLEVTMKENEVESVTGNTCKRGVIYAQSECTDPRRVVTSTVGVLGSAVKRVPVKTAQPIPKEKVFAAAEEIKKIRLNAPVKIGDVIIENVLDTGIDVVTSGNAE